jgi:hypothetical protein
VKATAGFPCLSLRLEGERRLAVGGGRSWVAQDTKVDIRIVEAVIVSELDELLAFADTIREVVNGPTLKS